MSNASIVLGEGGKAKARSPWAILVAMWLMGFGMEAPLFSTPPMLHIIREELSLTNAEVALVFAIPLIILAALAIPCGTLADRVGARRVIGIGILVIIAGSFLRGVATDFATLLAFTCLYGVGFALVYPILPKVVGTWFPPEKIGLATGIYATGIITSAALVMAISLPVVFPVTNTFQGVFYIWTIPAVVAAISWWIIVRDSPRANVPSQQVDLKPIELKEVRPHYTIWTNKTLWLVAILFACHNFIFYTGVNWIPQFMMVKGASQELAALITSAITWAALPIVFLAPWASDKLGLRKLFLWASFAILIFTLLGIIYAPLSLGWLLTVFFGIATGVQFSIILVLAAELVPPEGVGRASGMILSIGYIGGLIGPWLAGYIMDITGNLNVSFIVLLGIAAIATCLSFILPETGPRARLHK